MLCKRFGILCFCIFLHSYISYHGKTLHRYQEILTDECDYEDAEDDPEDVAEDVHDHDGEESHRQVELALSLLVLPPAQNLGESSEAELDISQELQTKVKQWFANISNHREGPY